MPDEGPRTHGDTARGQRHEAKEESATLTRHDVVSTSRQATGLGAPASRRRRMRRRGPTEGGNRPASGLPETQHLVHTCQCKNYAGGNSLRQDRWVARPCIRTRPPPPLAHIRGIRKLCSAGCAAGWRNIHIHSIVLSCFRSFGLGSCCSRRQLRCLAFFVHPLLLCACCFPCSLCSRRGFRPL